MEFGAHKFKRTFGGTRAVSARAWMAQLSTAGMGMEKSAPAKLERSKTLAVEQWDGTKWVTRLLEWDGTSYVDAGGAR